MSKPVPINLVQHAAMLEDGREFLRMWAKTDGPMACFLNPAQLGADPFLFGMALADAVRHGARAWARAVNIPFEHAEERIWEGLDAERAKPTDSPREPDTSDDSSVITYTSPKDLH